MSTEHGTGAGAGTTPSSSSIDLESIRAIAKKDFQDAVRSWLFWGLSLFFFLLLVIVTGAISYFAGDAILAEGATTEALVQYVHGVTSMVIPLIGLVLGWKAIIGERESGSIKILLSLPHSRKDVILGKLLGRSAVLSLSLVVGFVLAAVIVAVLLGSFSIVDYIGLLAVSILYGVVFTSIAIMISSLSRSTTIAIAALIALFLFVYLLWDTVVIAVVMLITFDYLPESDLLADALLTYIYFNPGTAYSNVLSLVTSVGELGQQNEQMVTGISDGDTPFFIRDWFSLLVLLFWSVVPTVIALFQFDRTDL